MQNGFRKPTKSEIIKEQDNIIQEYSKMNEEQRSVIAELLKIIERQKSATVG